MKTCFRCGVSKALEDFYRHPAMADGRLDKCKACTRADVRRRHLARLDAVRAYDRARASLPQRRQLSRDVLRRERLEHPDRIAARAAARDAARRGSLAKAEACERCGLKGRLELHHADYSRPLFVAWLCKPCHAIADGERRRQEWAA
jgi:hypothetical protein